MHTTHHQVGACLLQLCSNSFSEEPHSRKHSHSRSCRSTGEQHVHVPHAYASHGDSAAEAASTTQLPEPQQQGGNILRGAQACQSLPRRQGQDATSSRQGCLTPDGQETGSGLTAGATLLALSLENVRGDSCNGGQLTPSSLPTRVEGGSGPGNSAVVQAHAHAPDSQVTPTTLSYMITYSLLFCIKHSAPDLEAHRRGGSRK